MSQVFLHIYFWQHMNSFHVVFLTEMYWGWRCMYDNDISTGVWPFLFLLGLTSPAVHLNLHVHVTEALQNRTYLSGDIHVILNKLYCTSETLGDLPPLPNDLLNAFPMISVNRIENTKTYGDKPQLVWTKIIYLLLSPPSLPPTLPSTIPPPPS